MTEKQYKTVFIFLDTDKYASPFDMLVTLDAIPDVTIIKFENVNGEDASKIIYDTIFPRGPAGAKHTKIFINGSNFDQVNEVLKQTQKCMFPPFENSIVVDPRGAYTTAAAAVAKTLKMSLKKGLGTLEGKNVTVLAGTGPVGKVAARLYASEKANVIITTRSFQKGADVASKINKEFGGERVKVIEARTPEQTGEAIKKADIILAAGAGGIQLLSLKVLEEYGTKCKIAGDVNAIPPVGVEGLGSNEEGKEIKQGVFGIGALAIGRLKIKIETKLIKRATAEPRGLFDYSAAYDIGKTAVLKKHAKTEKQ